MCSDPCKESTLKLIDAWRQQDISIIHGKDENQSYTRQDHKTRWKNLLHTAPAKFYHWISNNSRLKSSVARRKLQYSLSWACCERYHRLPSYSMMEALRSKDEEAALVWTEIVPHLGTYRNSTPIPNRAQPCQQLVVVVSYCRGVHQ